MSLGQSVEPLAEGPGFIFSACTVIALKIITTGAGEMTQWLTVCSALADLEFGS